MFNVTEAVNKVKAAGTSNTRIVDKDGGKCAIEVNVNGAWTAIADNISRKIAEDIVGNAANRVICG